MSLTRSLSLAVALSALCASLPASAEPPPATTAAMGGAPMLPVAPLPAGYYPPPPASYPPPAGYYAGARQPLPMEQQSPAAIAGGIVAVSIGSAFMLAGAVVGLGESSCSGGTCDSNTPLVAGLLVGSVVALGAGIPLLIYGTKKVPMTTATSTLPAWAGAPAGRGWQWRF